VSFEGSGEDDGSISSYNWESDLDGFLSSRNTFSAFTLSVGVHIISFTVRDNKGAWSEADIMTVTVLKIPENILPTAIIDEVAPARATEGEDVNFVGHGEDEDGAIEEYFWESDLDGLLSDERSFVTNDLSVGNHLITLRVRDEVGDWSETDEIVIIVEEKEEDNFFAGFDLQSFEKEPELCSLYIILLIIMIVGLIALAMGRRKKKRERNY
jgi:PKD repeat protein